MVDRARDTPRQSGTLQMAEAWAEIAHDHALKLEALAKELLKPPRASKPASIRAMNAAGVCMKYAVQFRSWATRAPDPETRARIGAEWRTFLHRAKGILAAR